MLDCVKIKDLIERCDEVFITAHKNIDLDAIGAILGMYYISNNFGKNAHVIVDDEQVSKEVKRAFYTLEETDNIVATKYNDIKNRITDKSLLIIVDTNRKTRVQNEKLLKIKNKIIIDHHVETCDLIENVAYKFIDIKASSSIEIVLDLINELNIYIPSAMATIMFAGMYIDTNGFLHKSTEKTHVCVSMLYKFGLDNKEAQYLLKQNFNEFKRRQKLTLKTEIFGCIAITALDNKYSNVELAKASDVLLSFENIEASFAIAKLDDDIVGISARSLGNIDVESIMHNFNGGGHKTDAATQIKGKTVDSVKEELLDYLGGLE